MLNIRRHSIGQVNAGFDSEGNPIFGEGPQQQTSSSTSYTPNISYPVDYGGYGTPSHTAQPSSTNVSSAAAVAAALLLQQQQRGLAPTAGAAPTPTWVYAAGAGVALLAVVLVMGR